MELNALEYQVLGQVFLGDPVGCKGGSYQAHHWGEVSAKDWGVRFRIASAHSPE